MVLCGVILLLLFAAALRLLYGALLELFPYCSVIKSSIRDVDAFAVRCSARCLRCHFLLCFIGFVYLSYFYEFERFRMI